ncbi:MAG: hypothetical protein ACREEL_14240 [Stellaceae bacterium]
MKRALVAVVAVSWAFAGAAMAESPGVSVPIQSAATPIIPAPSATPPVIAPMPPDAHALSQINPTAGPAVPKKAALKPVHKPPVRRATAASHDQLRETKALNLLAAAGYGSFHDVRRVGRDYQATVDDPRGSYTVNVDPDGGRIAPASAAADRETRALNLLADRGYVQINAIRPAGAGFAATVTQDGKSMNLAVDPDRNQIVRGN